VLGRWGVSDDVTMWLELVIRGCTNFQVEILSFQVVKDEGIFDFISRFAAIQRSIAGLCDSFCVHTLNVFVVATGAAATRSGQ